MTRKIVFLARSLNTGGAERQLIELADGLQRAGWTVKVVTFYGGGALEPDVARRGIAVEVIGKRGRWDIFGFLYRLAQLLRRERPDILHGYLIIANILTVLLKPWLRNTHVVWGVRASNMDLTHYDWLARASFRIGCSLSRFADLIICNSRSGQRFHVEHGYPAARMVVVPNGIDTERFAPDAVARHELRQEWGVRDDEILIGRIGRLDPMKDYPTFLRAAAQLARMNSRLRFVCVGAGPEPYRSTLQELARELGLNNSLIWAGSRVDVPRVYNAVDLIVSSSCWGEGFPNVIGEAMASGVECIVTDVGDSGSIVGESGHVVAPGSPDAIARAVMERLARGNLRAQAETLRTRVTAFFSIAALVDSSAQLLQQLAPDRQIAPPTPPADSKTFAE